MPTCTPTCRPAARRWPATRLGQNQRAVGPLITALNRLFSQHGQAFLQPGLHYQPVTEGAKPKPLLHDATLPRAALQLWTLPRQRSGPLPKADLQRRAAASCASEIARLLAGARAGHIQLGGAPLAAGHIAVLVRSHAQGSLMRQALATLGVGSVELSQASVFHGPDADELERLLAAMLQPGRDGLLKAALATRWHGLTATAIDTLASDDNAWLDRVQAFARHGALWRQRGVGVALQHWRQAEQVAERLLAAPDGARRLTNLLHLGELLHQASATQPSPEALLRWLQAQRDSSSGDEATQLRLESDQHLVQIVTIHKSKGLEYPVVFCPFLWDGRSPGNSDGLDGVPGHDADGLAVLDFRTGLDPRLDPSAARAQARLDAAAESLRLVYVALTRAVQRCYLLVGSYTTQAFGRSSSTESARSMLNWLLLGGGLQGSDWFNAKRKPATPAELDAAWAGLADAGQSSTRPAPGAGPHVAAIAVAPLPAALAGPLPADEDGPAALQALPPPSPLPRGWSIASFSSLAAGAGSAPGAPPGQAAAWADSAAGSESSAGHDADADRPLQPRAGADHDAAVAAAEAGDSAGTGWAGGDSIDFGFGFGGDLDPAADLAAAAAAPGAAGQASGAAANAMTRTDAGAASSAYTGANTSATLPADDILRFPRGTQAGECVHAAFELADFSDTSSWPAAIDRALQRHGPLADAGTAPLPLAGMLQQMLADVLATPLPVGTATPLRLDTLTPRQHLAEMEFHLHAPQLSAAALARTLAAHGVPAPRLGFGQLQGYLKGFIDAVLQHDGRWFIVDWKSNHLGDGPSDYGHPAMQTAMLAHHYPLQALVYSLALQRWLQQRLPGYQHAQHFGGALYLFVRGLRPGWLQADGTPTGLQLLRPSAALLDDVSALLDGGAT